MEQPLSKRDRERLSGRRSDAKIRSRRLAARECVECGKPRNDPDGLQRWYCAPCRQKQCERFKRHREEMRSRKLLLRLQSPPKLVSAYRRDYFIARRKYRKDNHLCVHCNVPLEPDRKLLTCQACSEKHAQVSREYRRRLKAMRERVKCEKSCS